MILSKKYPITQPIVVIDSKAFWIKDLADSKDFILAKNIIDIFNAKCIQMEIRSPVDDRIMELFFIVPEYSKRAPKGKIFIQHWMWKSTESLPPSECTENTNYYQIAINKSGEKFIFIGCKYSDKLYERFYKIDNDFVKL